MASKQIFATSNQTAFNPGYFTSAARIRREQFSLLRIEIEMLAKEEANLMKIAGAAALFISHLEHLTLPREAIGSAATLARLVNEMPDDLMSDALQLLHA
ncbi:MAG: hypothetical protein KGZ83_18550 [Sulfuricella sp.]|nr:hypothetical protein [Sulfuricella sp.]